MFGGDADFAVIPGFPDQFQAGRDDFLEDCNEVKVFFHLFQNSVGAGFVVGNQRAKEDFSIAADASQNPLLMHILNKTIIALDYDKLHNITMKYTVGTPYQPTWMDLFHKYRVTVSVAGLLLLVCLSLAAFIIRQRHRHYMVLNQKNEQLSLAIKQAESK